MMDAVTDPEVYWVVFMTSAQVGKALALDTPIPTVGGWTTIGEIEVGDSVFDESGNPCRVQHVMPIMSNRPCFDVSFSDGSSFIADAEHEWVVDSDTAIGPGVAHSPAPREGILTTAEISQTLHYGSRGQRNRYAVRVASPLTLPESEFLIPPYVLGVWLGDGNSHSANITFAESDSEILEHIEAEGIPTRRAKSVTSGIAVLAPYGCGIQTGHSRLVALGVLKNKHIPPNYLRASESQRLALVQGLMDTDGHVSKMGRCEFVTTTPALADGMSDLLASLGIKHTIKDIQPTTVYKGKRVNGKPAKRFSFLVYDDKPVFRLRRKLARLKSRVGGRASETERRRIVSVEPVESVPVRCIQVDSASHLYLAGRQMIPTHNSEVIFNALGYFIHQDASPILFALPTDKLAEAISKDRIAPMIRDTPVLNELISAAKSRDSSNTLLHKSFPGGTATLVGSNSPANVSSRPIRIFLEDEKDRFAKSAGTEGNVSSLGWARTKNFFNRKRVSTSTPTEKGFSPIEDDYELSDQRKYFVPCPHCETLQPLEWSGIKWDRDEDGEHLPSTARYICAHCEKDIDEASRGAMLTNGEWIATADFNGIAGFYINELYSPWRHWRETVSDFLNSKDDPEKLKVWTNTALGQTWEVEAETQDPDGLFARREEFHAEAPEGVKIVTAGVDVQKDRWEVSYWGYGVGEESWRLDHVKIYGDTSKLKEWETKLDPALMRSFKGENGSLQPACSLIDAGYQTEIVYQFVKPRLQRKIYACHGKDGTEKAIIHMVTKSKHGKGEKPGTVIVGVDSAKDLLFAFLNVEKAGPGYVHFGMDTDHDYLEQLTAEVVRTKHRFGRPVRYWELPPGKRNECLDCRVYSHAALRLLNVRWDSFVDKPKPKQARPRRKQGFVGSWKR